MAAPQVTPLVETLHDGGFIVSVANGHQSIEQIVLTGAAKVYAGTLLGKVTSALTAAAVALGTNTGNGTFGAITVSNPPTQPGVYSLVYSSATAFTVTAPDGATATGTNGVAFSALGIGFTMTTGGTPMVVGDGFTITITQAPGKPTAASVANGGNVGNSTSSAVTTVGYPAIPGSYAVEFDAATLYVVNDPNGQLVGRGTTGVAFSSGGLNFTITAGGTPFAAADAFIVTVAPGTGSYKTWDPGNADGSSVVAGILYATRDATLADKPAAAVVRLAEVNASELLYPTGASAATIALGISGLKSIGIFPR